MKLTKEKAISIIHESAAKYNINLINKNVLFLCLHKNRSDYLECSFTNSNFLHLTGVDTSIEPVQFYNAVIDSRLRTDDFHLKTDGTTELKLSVLLRLMDIHSIGRMIGDYDYSGRVLVADKLAGTTTAVMGFMQGSNYYYPSSTLKENLANIAKKPYSKIVATFIKPQQDELYTELSYALNDKEVFTDNVLSSIKDKVDFPNLKASFPIPWDNEEQA